MSVDLITESVVRSIDWSLGAGPPLVFVRIPEASFVMGFADSPDEAPVHLHHLASAYYIGRDPVTWAQYLAFCEATRRTAPEAPPWGSPADHPVVGVSFEDATAYCGWAGVRLPTEAEWELAARGESGQMYPWGSDEPPDFAPNDLCVTWSHPIWGTEARATTAPVDADVPDVSPWGARQMAGNVGEWVADAYEERAYDRYAEGDFTPPAEAPNALRVIRGTNWQGPARYARAACRINAPANTKSTAFGFRVAVDAAVAERNRRVRVRPIEDLRIGPRLPIEDFARAREAIEAGDHQIALDAARRSLANAPELVAAHGVVGRALVAMGQKTQAAQAYETAIEVCVYNPTLLARAAVALHAAGRASAAAELQSKVAAAAPEGGQASVNEVITLWSAARFQEAISVADALVQRGQDPVPVRLIRGLARFELNDAKGALQDLDAHLALAEGDTAARNIRADLLTALKRPDEAKAAYEDVLGRLDAQLATDPQQAGVRGRRAYTLLALGRANEALIEARHAAELDPDDALARRSIGRAHLVRDEIEEAVTALEAGREREPERIEILYDLARALARLDRTDEARPYLNQAIDRSPRLAYTAQRDRHLAPLLDDED